MTFMVKGKLLVKFEVLDDVMQTHILKCIAKSSARTFEDGLQEAADVFEKIMRQQAYGEYQEIHMDGDFGPDVAAEVYFLVVNQASVVAIKLSLSETLTNPCVFTNEGWVKF